MEWWSNREMNSCQQPALHYSNTPRLQFCSFLLIPFQHDAVHYAADLEEFFLVMHHVRAREAGDSVIFT